MTRAEIDAELLQDGALHLGDGHLQHHLLLALDGEQVDDQVAPLSGGRLAWPCPDLGHRLGVAAAFARGVLADELMALRLACANW